MSTVEPFPMMSAEALSHIACYMRLFSLGVGAQSRTLRPWLRRVPIVIAHSTQLIDCCETA
jgi:hypothetical protein